MRRSGYVAGCLRVILAASLWTGLALQGRTAEVVIAPENLVLLEPGVYRVEGIDPPEPGKRPVVDPADTDPVSGLIRRRVATGDAQGFTGIVYENRDRGHSQLKGSAFPALTALRYSPELRGRGLDYGLAGSVQMPFVTFGNSSTALTRGPFWRSQVRQAMTARGLPERMYETYRDNQIYVYPEHRDHDAADLYPANWPYTITSQGSSGSDQPFLKAIALTLAAFKPETFRRLRDDGLIAPTLQMILRRELASVTRAEHYFTDRAHPAVFQSVDLRPGRMAMRAAALQQGAIPPMVRLQVEEETFKGEAGLARLSEILFDTPSAIARIWRAPEGRQIMSISAAETRDPNDRALAFTWTVISGDTDKVRIEPLDPAGTRARIVIDWHAGQTRKIPISQGGVRRSSRVDIGVFASNGVEVSAPAFISVAFPVHQIRDYEFAGVDAPVLSSIDYDAADREVYFDPLLFWSAPWTDRWAGEEVKRRIAGGDWQTRPDTTYRIDRTDQAKPVLMHQQ